MTLRDAFRIGVTPVAIAISAAIVIRLTCFQIFAIPSRSMAPTLEPGDQIVVTPYRLPFDDRPERGDMIVFRHPSDGRHLVKRVVAIPGDHLELSGPHVRVNGKTIAEPYRGSVDETTALGPEIVPAGSYFVLGDNRADSVDSREWGTVSRGAIVGEVRAILWSVTESSLPVAGAETRGGNAQHPFRRACFFPKGD